MNTPRQYAQKPSVSSYPFGSTMQERVFSSGNYRFGFNNQEKDSELGDAYAFEYRIHDARLGRFLSVDPLFKKYPWYSSFQFAGNKTIRFIDFEGTEEGEPSGFWAAAWYYTKSITSSAASPFVTVGTSVGIPLCNQFMITCREGIHEGGAYNRKNVPFEYASYRLNNNWELEKIQGVTGDNITFRGGVEIMGATASAITTVLPLPSSTLGKRIGGMTAKSAVKKVISSATGQSANSNPSLYDAQYTYTDYIRDVYGTHVTSSANTSKTNQDAIIAKMRNGLLPGNTHEITGNGVRLHAGASLESTNLGLTFKGDGATTTGYSQNGLTQVKLNDGTLGWVSSIYLKPLESNKESINLSNDSNNQEGIR